VQVRDKYGWFITSNWKEHGRRVTILFKGEQMSCLKKGLVGLRDTRKNLCAQLML